MVSTDAEQEVLRGSQNTNTDSEGKNPAKKKYPLWKNVLAMMIVLAVFIACAYWASVIYTRHGDEVEVPNLNGLTVKQAMERLDALELYGEIRDSIYNRDIAPGLVCGQTINAGNKVKIGRTIGLTVNSDHAPTLVLPDVADNMSYREATAKLRSMGFTLGEPEFIDGEKDWVYSVRYKGCNNGHYMMDELEFEETYGDTIGAIAGDILEIF